MSADMKSVASNTTDAGVINRLATNPYYTPMMRTTLLVLLLVEAGHAMNALPQSAKAIINCRVLPGTSQEEVEKTIVNVLSDSRRLKFRLFNYDKQSCLTVKT